MRHLSRKGALIYLILVLCALIIRKVFKIDNLNLPRIPLLTRRRPMDRKERIVWIVMLSIVVLIMVVWLMSLLTKTNAIPVKAGELINYDIESVVEDHGTYHVPQKTHMIYEFVIKAEAEADVMSWFMAQYPQPLGQIDESAFSASVRDLPTQMESYGQIPLANGDNGYYILCKDINDRMILFVCQFL